jgi:hypothetical protein
MLSSLVDSNPDLTSRWLFWHLDMQMHTPDLNYRARRRRLKPIAVVMSSTLMGMAGAGLIGVLHLHTCLY